jgi:NAD-dependent dihydropyrimidine dehydrogenase PreA subunit
MHKDKENWKLLIEINQDKCDFCGCCVGVCPEDAIELKEAQIGIIESECTNCSKCVWSCPVEAIKFNKDELKKQTVVMDI